MFTPADKGNTTVAMNKNDYYKKMDLLLNDVNTYKIVKNNPLENLRKSSYYILSLWNENGFINRKFKKNDLTQTNTNIARCYGLPKIHKDNSPLDPLFPLSGHLLIFFLNTFSQF